MRWEAEEVLIGTVKSDNLHADGSGNFVRSLNDLLAMQEGGLRLAAPAIGLDSTELLVRSGVSLELLGWTHSCHTDNFACGHCRGCSKHLAVMREVREISATRGD